MMLARTNYPTRRPRSQQQQHQHQKQHHPPQQPYYNQHHLEATADSHSTPTRDFTNGYPSTSSPLSHFDSLPTTAAAAIAATQRYNAATSQTQQAFDTTNASQALNQVPDLMPSSSSDSWMLQNQQTPRTAHRFGHQRESSLSSLGSNGPASPYNPNTSNPQIAVTESGQDAYTDVGTGVDTPNHYTYGALGKPLSFPDSFYTNALATLGNSSTTTSGTHDVHVVEGLPNLTSSSQSQKSIGDRSLAPPPDASATKSHPVSVASSIAGGDSPATPTYHEPEDDGRKTKNVYSNGNPPKLDRTMTDIYNDELYNPDFTITSASPPSQTQLAMSPSSDLFAQRLQAANSQHLNAVQSPVSNPSRDRSPFRQGSPYASAIGEFPQVSANQVRLGSAQHLREKRKAEQDARELQKQMARSLTQQQQQQQGTPSTISPKDAIIEFNESDENSNFPLFPPQETGNFGLDKTDKDLITVQAGASQQLNPTFQSIGSTPLQSGFNFSMASNLPMPQQYPFVARRQQPQPQQMTPTGSNFSRVSSAEASVYSDGGSEGSIQKPARTAADGGTYTCTYHGCTQRFETPALLQKHKREGHRQANALNHVRASSASLTGNLLNSQAGPHRCDRINPSTGKPCDTVFSRPYDLTRHEDTIHNARKQKVRCDLCTEEKTFSRADALTRHYRVCHPDVEFPGKHRRRGGGSDM
ncbi:hypothetical protein F4778DRAFT_475981 [Xylariomycetidae sp. FL2044]|nr:hypothetical protein F4778DRAFT_475981 [Xylariomycetidae sp. FL2044]